MRRLHPFVLLVTLASLCAWARAESAASEADAREAAVRTLDGRTAIVRLYTDWKTNPKAYATLSVPLEGLDVTFEAVRQAAARELPKDTAVAVVPGDQRDSEVARVMDGCLFGERLGVGGRFALWPGSVAPFRRNSCLFKDALGDPLANAQVEILLTGSSMMKPDGETLWIADARLDGAGRMPPVRACTSLRMHTVVCAVLHPDCGRVYAIERLGNPQDEHEFLVPALPKEKWCAFVDALGRPMAGATVDVVTSPTWEQRRPGKTSLPSIRLDEAGRLCPPPENPTLQFCCFLVYDPNYGTAIVEPRLHALGKPDEPADLCVVPLVPAATQEDERSIWGTVVDSEGVPIPEAVVQCAEVRTLGGGSLRRWCPGQPTTIGFAKVLTDAQGRFAMHLPLANSDGTLGRPVPPGATYEVMIDSATGVKVQRLHAQLAAGREHTIVVERKREGPSALSGTLVFQDERGPVADVEKLRLVTLSIQRRTGAGRSEGTTFGPGGWLEKTELEFGTYSATAEWDGKLYVFEPVEVTAKSPKTIVFTPKEIMPTRSVYCGRVVNGVTGSPIAGALVLLRPEPGAFHEPDEKAAKRIYYLGPETDANDLIDVFKSDPQWPVTWTDRAGRFEMSLRVMQLRPLFVTLVAIKRHFLGAELQLSAIPSQTDPFGQRRFREFEMDAEGRVLLPEMKLFPAGTVMLEPRVPDREKDVRFYYRTAPDDPTPWLKDLWATPNANEGLTVFRKNKLPINQSQKVYVPAGVTLTLVLQRIGDQFTPVVIEPVYLRQGEVLDLGRVEFAAAVQVIVKTINSAGKPLEGITVKCRTDGIGYASLGAVTDDQGLARVATPQNSQGRFVVEYFDRESMTAVREGTPYEIRGPQDEGREFVLVLSDEFLEQLRNAR